MNIKIEDGGFSCEVLAYSQGPKGDLIWTVVARYPRVIHDEILTHKEFARNSASSRAIPVLKFNGS